MRLDRVYYAQLTSPACSVGGLPTVISVDFYTFFDNVTYDSDPGYRDFVR